MKGIYLAAGNAVHSNYDIIYQDINNKRDIGGDMLDIELESFDYIIASPPCNYWSIARGSRCSNYSILTKHLLPCIIDKCIKLSKPFIVENVKNNKRMTENGIIPRNDCIVFTHGRHIYFTNVPFEYSNIPQRQDFKHHGYVIKYEDMDNQYHQGGYNVHNVIEAFLHEVHNRKEVENDIQKQGKS